MTEDRIPAISVIIPCHNAEAHLPRVLRALTESSHQALEIRVVDDSSTDRSRELAHEFGATVTRLAKRQGPAAARNCGARDARGEILFFIDSDVCVSPQTLDRIATAFAADPSLSALIGSYDDQPHTADFLSQYRNLMHHYVHQTGQESASTFWSGCGAIRRSVFRELSGFNESYGRPAIEDIELGYRLNVNGYKVLLDHDLTVKHLKRWTFWNLVKTDVFDRGIPWTELIMRDRRMPNDLNLQLSQRVSVALAFLMVTATAAAAVHWRGYVLTPLFALVFFLLARFWAEPSAERTRSATLWLTLAMVGIVVLAALHHMYGLIPPLVLSQLLLFSRHRYAGSSVREKKVLRRSVLIYLCFSVIACIYYLPSNALLFTLFFAAATIGLLNSQFYLFLAAKRGVFFAMAAVPFHLLYHFYNGVSFIAGAVRFWLTGGSSRSESAGKLAHQPGEPRK